MKVLIDDPVPCGACALGRASRPGPCPFHDVRRPAGTVLLCQGETPESVWFVRQGTVLLSSVSENGEETLCSLRGSGSLLGLEALHGRPLQAQAWALSEVLVCRVGGDEFRAWVGDRGTPMGTVLELALDEATRRQGERIALAGPAVTRVARFLVERRRMEGADRPLPVEHQVLARMLGMRAETLSRALARLRAAGALARSRTLQVIDARRLAEFAIDD